MFGFFVIYYPGWQCHCPPYRPYAPTPSFLQGNVSTAVVSQVLLYLMSCLMSVCQCASVSVECR